MPGTNLDLYYTHKGQIINQDRDGQNTSANTILETEERKRKADDYTINEGGSGGAPPSTPKVPTVPRDLMSQGVDTQPPFEASNPVLATLEDIFTLFEPVIDSIVASTYNINPLLGMLFLRTKLQLAAQSIRGRKPLQTLSIWLVM